MTIETAINGSIAPARLERKRLMFLAIFSSVSCLSWLVFMMGQSISAISRVGI
jgi:hypothetical protein